MKFTKEQKKHLRSIRWLFDESTLSVRQSGRSTLLAYVYIAQVIATGKSMKIMDHLYISNSNVSPAVNKLLANTIDKIIEEEKLPLKILWSTLILSLK